ILARYPTAEARTVGAGELETAADAQTVAEAMLDWYSAQRIRCALELFATDELLGLSIATAIDTTASLRMPPITNGSGLLRLVKVSESPPTEQGPQTLALEGIAHFDPVAGPQLKAA